MVYLYKFGCHSRESGNPVKERYMHIHFQINKLAVAIVCMGIITFTQCTILQCFAATAGNTGGVNTLCGKGVFSLKETRNISIEGALDVDVVLDRDLKAGDVTNARFETSEWSMFRLGCRMFDRVEPYVRFGWAHLKAGWTDIDSGTKIEMMSKSDFAWGLGVKGLIYDFKNPKIKIAGDCSYRTSDADPEKGYFDGTKTEINKKESVFVIREWQAALMAVTEMDLEKMFNHAEWLKGYKLSPYGGIAYSEISGRIRLVTADSGATYHPDNIKSDRNFGIVVGCDLVGEDYVSLNVEGRFIDKTAVSGGLAMLF
jgi:opacity protein-like surface antigen